MERLLAKYLHAPRSPADGGGSGGGDAGAPADSSGAPANSGEKPAGSDSTGEGKPPAWNPTWPEGFPEQLRGTDEAETLHKVNAALKGYRDKDAARDIPADPKGYLSVEGLKDFQLPDSLKPHFEQLASDPFFEPLGKAAKELGLERPKFLGMWKAGMELLNEAGMLEPLVDPAAERAQLLPDAAKAASKADQDKAIDARMTENYDFVDLMVANRGLDKDSAEYAKLMLGDRANGHKFLEWVKAQIQAGGQQPGGHGGGAGGDTRESLKAELAKPEMKPGHPQFDRARYDALDARYKALLEA